MVETKLLDGQFGDKKDPQADKTNPLREPPNDQAIEEDSDILPAREQWSSKVDFVLSCVGFAVGLGNVWRFPYLCYTNGGGAFLVPYLVCLVCGGVPVFFLEISLGQFMSQGGVGVWKLCPIFQGIGIAATIVLLLMNPYYIIILAWDLYYMWMAFTPVLPWSHCNNSWNTPNCTVSFGVQPICGNVNVNVNSTVTSAGMALHNCTTRVANYTAVDPVVEFWERKILQISSGVDEPGGLVWELALALLVSWVICYFCIWKGVKWTGKVVYFTATFPYVILTALLIRGVTLDGATEGILFYLRPDFTRLSDSQVWIDAGSQVFFTYGVAMGVMPALGSYNKFHNNCYRDCILIAVINTFTSFYSGFVIFSVLGFMAKEQGVSIEDVAESGPGLAFIAYPKAVTLMPLAPLWAVLFFFMILLVGLDSMFVPVKAFLTIICDAFSVLRTGYKKEIFAAVYCALSYLIGLTMVTRGGMYVFQLFNYYCANGLLCVSFFESICVAWVYGGRRFYDNIELMIGYRINPWLLVCWTVLTPIITAGIFIFSWVQFQPLTYNKIYKYPAWAQGLGMCMALASTVCIPVFFIGKLLVTKGSLAERWRIATTPEVQPHQTAGHPPETLKLGVMAGSDPEQDTLIWT